jgi:hypothetical protein
LTLSPSKSLIFGVGEHHEGWMVEVHSYRAYF